MHQVPTEPRPWSPSATLEKSSEVSDTPLQVTPKAPRPAARPVRPSVAADPKRPRQAAAGPSASKGVPAGFWIRLAAYLIDNVIIMIPMIVVAAISVPVIYRSTDEGQLDPSSAWVLFLPAVGGLLTAVLAIVYPIYFWAVRGATPGKSLLGLKVVTTEGKSPIGMKRSVLRLVGYMINGFTFSIGFLLIAFSEDKRGLHDRIAETAVVRRR
jgi:uncharacterized RDD family membrane protein YckC